MVILFLIASVSRIAKYFHSEGTPVITVGGFSYEFSEPKTSCEDEYYQLIRAGTLSYKSIALFTVDIMKR